MTRFVFPFLALTICVAGMRGRRVSRILGVRGLFAVGGISYSIYLLHQPIVMWLGHLTNSLPRSFEAAFVIDALLLVPAVLAASGLFFVLVERPSMDPRWPKKVAMAVRQAVTVSSVRGRVAAASLDVAVLRARPESPFEYVRYPLNKSVCR
jgi:peptidoglycan/LPS O-acetylase OafA/YrhL